jgi:hypothetical protein
LHLLLKVGPLSGHFYLFLCPSGAALLILTHADAEQVRQFHTAALKAGGTCNGPPGLREHYHPSYYGAFVRDPLFGLNFEVVCHKGA